MGTTSHCQCAPVRAVVSTILVGLRETLANAGVEYMVSAGSNPVSPDMGENLDLSLILSPLKSGVNAERTTSPKPVKTGEPSWSMITPAVDTVLKVFSIWSPQFSLRRCECVAGLLSVAL